MQHYAQNYDSLLFLSWHSYLAFSQQNEARLTSRYFKTNRSKDGQVVSDRKGKSIKEFRDCTQSKIDLINEDFKMSAASFVVLVMFDILCPKLAPHLDKCSPADVELNKYQRRHIIWEVEIWVVFE